MYCMFSKNIKKIPIKTRPKAKYLHFKNTYLEITKKMIFLIIEFMELLKFQYR